ncbi:recombinase family protein [Streptomycetaceae bacterium NBC_01309]
MTRSFGFYGRVSTEDHQDPVASRNWQRERASGLIKPYGGVIVAEFFDAGDSRALPWKRRPQAAALLECFKRPDRGFDAVVVGEPQRAFYGNQYGLTFPVFCHYGIQLWVPEAGGPIDEESDAHELVMALFGGMSKGERQRITIRVRSSMAAQAKIEGRFLGGRPPYGYMLEDAGPHPHPAKAAEGKRLRRLALDPTAAPVVARIYAEYLSGIGIYAIAQRLTADQILCPSAHDPARNRHRSGVAWPKGAVRTILINPRYTGHEVWNKQRKVERSIDVEDVALGHDTHMEWNPKYAWVYSEQPTHAPIVGKDAFAQVQQRLHSRGPQSVGRVVRTKNPYALKGLFTHVSCGRRMQGHWNNSAAYYRCRFPSEYALANGVDHPLGVYVREDAVLPHLDRWLASAFAPERAESALSAVEHAQPERDFRIDAAKRRITECDRKIARHRAALEAGASPNLVAKWTGEVEAERTAAEHRLAQMTAQHPHATRMTREELRAVINSLASRFHGAGCPMGDRGSEKCSLPATIGLL